MERPKSRDLKEMGVDFYTITGNGLEEVYNHGYAKGVNYIADADFVPLK